MHGNTSWVFCHCPWLYRIQNVQLGVFTCLSANVPPKAAELIM